MIAQSIPGEGEGVVRSSRTHEKIAPRSAGFRLSRNTGVRAQFVRCARDFCAARLPFLFRNPESSTNCRCGDVRLAE
jgi:hypothetical protein